MQVFPFARDRIRPISQECSRDTRFTSISETWFSPASRPIRLSAGTRVPGEFIKKFVPGADPFGTVQLGNRADLVLLNQPLDIGWRRLAPHCFPGSRKGSV
jgi:hypothetical protein